MTAVPTQDQLVRFDEIHPETKPIAVLRQEPPELTKRRGLKFCEGYDDLDYLVFSVSDLPSRHRVAFVRYKRSPSPGTEVWVVPDEPAVAETLTEAIQFLGLSAEDLSWIHPEYETEVWAKNWLRSSRATVDPAFHPEPQNISTQWSSEMAPKNWTGV